MLRLIGTVGGGMTPDQLEAALAPVRQLAQAAQNQALGAEARAEQAEATGQNARQMVLNDRPKISDAQTAAQQAAAKADAIDVKRSEYEAALAASIADRAGLRAAMDALTARVAALEALKVTVGWGTATLTGSLLAGATRDVQVALSRDMGSTSYSAGSSLSGGASLLGQLVHDGIVSQTKTTVTVRVRNVGLTSIANLSAAVVYVVAARDA